LENNMSERRLFGTDGIRGRANVWAITPELALRLGRAITLVARRGNARAPRVVIGKDTRRSGYMLETALAAGICAMGGRVDGSLDRLRQKHVSEAPGA
jgi:phosphoglucosamine mutase